MNYFICLVLIALAKVAKWLSGFKRESQAGFTSVSLLDLAALRVHVSGMSSSSEQPPFEHPIDGTLDLHLFAPADTREVLLEYIRVCLERKVYQLRIVHGKGIGVKREIVHSVLKGHKNVRSYRHEAGSGGGYGATVVDLKP